MKNNKKYFEMFHGSKITSRVLMSILKEEAVSCGSGCFQDATGSYFLGKPSKESILEAFKLMNDKKTKPLVVRKVMEFLTYVFDGDIRYCTEHERLEEK